jgi:flavorubredoxin
MEMIIGIISIIVMVVILGYTGLVTTGYDNFKGINLQLDEMYTSSNEMAYAVFEELKKQGKECEIIESGKEYPRLLINSKKYIMTSKMTSMTGFPAQTVQLKICKE